MSDGKGKPMLVFRQLSYLAFAGFAALLAVKAQAFPGLARDYPVVLAILVIIGSLANLVHEWRVRARSDGPAGDVARLLGAVKVERPRLWGFALLWLLYPLGLSCGGFLVPSILWLSASLWLLRYRRLGRGIAGAVILCLALSVLFATVFFIPVPQGAADAWVTALAYRLQG